MSSWGCNKLICPLGMLTFITYYLVKNPEAMRKLREEIDTKIGSRPMTMSDVHKLPYLIGKFRDSNTTQ